MAGNLKGPAADGKEGSYPWRMPWKNVQKRDGAERALLLTAVMRYFLNEHPVLFATGMYLYFVVHGSLTTLRGDRAGREYQRRENSIFRWFLKPGFPFENESRFVSARKIGAWLLLVIGTFVYLIFVTGKPGWQLPSPR